MDLESKRLKLHEELCRILGSRNCYYQPPSGMEMEYPCIVYDLNQDNPRFADNIPYHHALEWNITVIDEDPTSIIFDKMLEFPKCRFERTFALDDLNHFVFSLYF